MFFWKSVFFFWKNVWKCTFSHFLTDVDSTKRPNYSENGYKPERRTSGRLERVSARRERALRRLAENWTFREVERVKVRQEVVEPVEDVKVYKK